MNNGHCIKLCINYLFNYSVIRKGTECKCGNENSLQGYIKQNDDSLCDKKCNFTTSAGDNVSYPFGGEEAYSVYEAKLIDYKAPNIKNVNEKLKVMSELKNDSRYKGC